MKKVFQSFWEFLEFSDFMQLLLGGYRSDMSPKYHVHLMSPPSPSPPPQT